jgi:hypothetical protein
MRSHDAIPDICARPRQRSPGAPTGYNAPVARPSQSSALLFLALTGGLVVVLIPMCGHRQPEGEPLTVVRAQPAPSIDLSELHSIERDPIEIPDSGLDGVQGEWVVPGEEPSLAVRADAAQEEPRPSLTPPAVTPPAAVSGEPDAIARYLRDTEHALMSGQYWSSPDSLAQGLIGEMTQGQTGGLSTLRQSNEDVLARLQQIVPPPGCEAHHAETVATVSASVELLRRWESMLEQGDLAGFAGVAGEAEALRSRSQRVEAMTDALRRQSGR